MTATSPRRSAFAGVTAAAPTPQQPAPPTTAAKKEKVGFYQHPEDSARMRATYRMTNGPEGDESLSDFIAKAVLAEVERREAKHNSGQPFELADGGSLKAGRPQGH